MLTQIYLHHIIQCPCPGSFPLLFSGCWKHPELHPAASGQIQLFPTYCSFNVEVQKRLLSLSINLIITIIFLINLLSLVNKMSKNSEKHPLHFPVALGEVTKLFVLSDQNSKNQRYSIYNDDCNFKIAENKGKNDLNSGLIPKKFWKLIVCWSTYYCSSI